MRTYGFYYFLFIDQTKSVSGLVESTDCFVLVAYKTINCCFA